jgi:putative spermidine/putrescine transport system substrate-binding protein
MKQTRIVASVLAALSVGAVQAQDMNHLVQAAKKEGVLTTIALPHDWCGYGELLAGFKAKYGIKINELNPDAGSGTEGQQG